MITIIRPAYYAIDRVAEYCGLSTDDKSETVGRMTITLTDFTEIT